MAYQFFIGFVLIILAIGSITDIRTRTIPNALPIILIALFLIALLFAPELRADWPWRLASFGVSFVIGFALFAAGIMGGGDVKLFAALALWHNLTTLAALAILTSIAGLAVAVIFVAIAYVEIKRASAPEGALPPIRAALRSPIPYGVAIFIGQAWFVWLSWFA